MFVSTAGLRRTRGPYRQFEVDEDSTVAWESREAYSHASSLNLCRLKSVGGKEESYRVQWACFMLESTHTHVMRPQS